MKRTYSCVECGLMFAGKETADGRVVANNGPPEERGEIHGALCWQCAAMAQAGGREDEG